MLTLKDTSRRPKMIEAYSKLHYGERVRPRTRELIAELRAKPENNGKLPKGGSLSCIKQALNEIYGSEEADSTRDEVLEKIAEKIKLKEESNLPMEERTPEHFLE